MENCCMEQGDAVLSAPAWQFRMLHLAHRAATDALLDKYGVLKCSQRELERLDNSAVFGVRRSQFGVEALVDRRRVPPGLTVDRANMEDIMLYLIKGEEK